VEDDFLSVIKSTAQGRRQISSIQKGNRIPNISKILNEFHALDQPAKGLGHVDIGVSAVSFIALQAKRTAYVQRVETLRDTLSRYPNLPKNFIKDMNTFIANMRTKWAPLLDFPKKNPNRKLEVGEVI
jgi:hypothetical protein